jgi:hypothetical protein
MTPSQNYTQCFFVRWENRTLAALYRFLKSVEKTGQSLLINFYKMVSLGTIKKTVFATNHDI